MRALILGFLFLLAACGGDKPGPSKDESFVMSFGKASKVEAAVSAGAPASVKEYKSAASFATLPPKKK